MTLPSWTPLVTGTVAALAVVGWNLTQGVHLSALPAGRPALRVLAGLSAFLLLPALAITLLSGTAPGARVLGPLDWLWPVTTLGVLVAGGLAVAHGRLAAAPLILLLVDALAAWIAVTHWLQGAGVALAPWAIAPVAAASNLAAALLGDAVFPWGAALVVPALVPATPPRRWAASVALVTVTIGWSAIAAAIVVRIPQAHASVVAAERLVPSAASGARGALAIGVRLFGDLTSAPSAAVARRDVALADSLGVTAVHVALSRADISNNALDSIARALAPRRDSMTLIVTLRLTTDVPTENSSAERDRLAALERITRRLRPDVLVPADRIGLDDSSDGARNVARHYERVTTLVRRTNRRIVVALGTDASRTADSLAVEWVLQGDAPVAAIALSVRGDGAHPQRFVDALAAMSRWASLGRPPPDTWLLGVPSAPTITGERAQRYLVRYALAWATARPWVRGVIAGDASDVAGPVALRTARGRRRLALADVATALRLQRDATAVTGAEATQAPAAPSSPDSAVRPLDPTPP